MRHQKQQTVKFLGCTCSFEMGTYSNGRKAIELIDTKTGEPFLVASINFPFEPIGEDEIAIKNYSENQGILDVLVAAQIISQPTRFIQNGFISAPVCKLI